jgi:hypothetical protein
MLVSDVQRIMRVLNDSFILDLSHSESIELVALPILNNNIIEDITTSDLESLIDDRILHLIKVGYITK